MLHWAPSPVGQLRDAATSLITAGTDAQSGICCALVLSCAAVTQSSFVDTSCASCCVPPPPPSLLHLQALTAAAEGKFHVVKAGWIFFAPRHRAEAFCVWRSSATVRCPITTRAPWSHRRHRARSSSGLKQLTQWGPRSLSSRNKEFFHS